MGSCLSPWLRQPIIALSILVPCFARLRSISKVTTRAKALFASRLTNLSPRHSSAKSSRPAWLSDDNAVNSAPPLPGDRRRIDGDNRNLLSIFHFVVAGLSLLGMLFLFAHYTFLHGFLSDPNLWKGPKQTPPPPQFFVFFRLLYVFVGTWFVASGILNVLSGLFLRA